MNTQIKGESKTLEEEILNILDHNIDLIEDKECSFGFAIKYGDAVDVIASFIRSRESKRSGWVKASADQKPIDDSDVFIRVPDKEYDWCKLTGFYQNGIWFIHYPNGLDEAKSDFEWLDEFPSSVPEPDADKDQRIAELEKRLAEERNRSQKLLDDDVISTNKIQQLEAQLQASKVDAEKLFRKYATHDPLDKDGERIYCLMDEYHFIKAIQSIQNK